MADSAPTKAGDSSAVDHGALAAWIQPQHLSDDRLRDYRGQLQDHPGRLLVLHDFLAAEKADQLTHFLADEAEFKEEFGLYSVEGAVSADQWERAPADDRFFRYSRLAASPPQYQLSKNTLTYLRFRQTFQREQYKNFFEALTGLALGASDDFGVHSMRSGDFLRPHSDDNRNRRVALVLYLTPGWRAEYGGALEVTDATGRVTTVNPDYNSVAVFDVKADTTHQVTPVTSAAENNARLTIGGWYHEPDPGP